MGGGLLLIITMLTRNRKTVYSASVLVVDHNPEAGGLDIDRASAAHVELSEIKHLGMTMTLGEGSVQRPALVTAGTHIEVIGPLLWIGCRTVAIKREGTGIDMVVATQYQVNAIFPEYGEPLRAQVPGHSGIHDFRSEDGLVLKNYEILVGTGQTVQRFFEPAYLIGKTSTSGDVRIVHIQRHKKDVVAAEPIGSIAAIWSTVIRELEQMIECVGIVILGIMPVNLVGGPVSMVPGGAGVDKIPEHVVVQKVAPLILVSRHVDMIPAAEHQDSI